MDQKLIPDHRVRYHAYRLFVQSARLQETQSGSAFTPDAARAISSQNLMDRWILAAANGLVGFMRSEMEAAPRRPP